MERTKRFKGKKLRFPIIEEEVNKGMFSDQSDVGAEMPNSNDGVHHLRRTEPKEIHLLIHSEIEGAVGGSKVKTHPDKRVEGVKVIDITKFDSSKLPSSPPMISLRELLRLRNDSALDLQIVLG